MKTIVKKERFRSLLLSFFILGFLFSSCKDDDDFSTGQPTPSGLRLDYRFAMPSTMAIAEGNENILKEVALIFYDGAETYKAHSVHTLNTTGGNSGSLSVSLPRGLEPGGVYKVDRKSVV